MQKNINVTSDNASDIVVNRICVKLNTVVYEHADLFQGPRAQIDRAMYKRAIQEEVLNTHNLTVTAASVEDLILLSGREGNTEKQHCTGVILGQ